MKTTAAVIGIVMAFAEPAGAAMVDKYHVTDAEKAACQNDAAKLCSEANQDEDQLLGCMKANRVNLSASCRIVFDAGMRRRGLQ